MSDKARIAFIGCGGHSSRTLQPNAHAAANVELVAMCDLDEAKARSAARRWGVNAWFTDYNEMLERVKPDGVIVVGPPTMMQPIAKDLLSRGVNVMMEKPPAMTAALAKELVDACRASGARGMVATHWRHATPYAKARALLNQESFGPVTHCVGWFYAPGPTGPIWGTTDGFAAYVIGQGVHLVDCTRALMGDVTSVYATAKCQGELFDSCAVALVFANGATGLLSMASNAAYQTGHRIFSSTGSFLEVEDAKRLRYAILPSWTGQPTSDYENHSFQTWSYGPAQPGYGGLGYLEEITHFADCLLRGEQPQASIEDGYQAMRVLEAIRESALSGKAIDL